MTDLPPLPMPFHVYGTPSYHASRTPVYSDDQMRAYAEAAIKQERDRCAADVERYRWLREQQWDTAGLCVVTRPKANVLLGTDCPSLDRLDEAIDALRARSPSTPVQEKP